jgi:hypothetical protein
MDVFFQINESLKDKLVEHFGITYAKTIFHKNGGLYLEDPFYETEARWPTYEAFKSLSWEEADDLGQFLYKTKLKVEESGGQMTPPLFEVREGVPQVVWAIFLNKT